MSSNTAEEVTTVVEAQPVESNHGTSLSVICSVVAILSMASLRRLCTNYYQQGAFGEEAPIMPGPTLSFVIAVLLSFAAIKAQGQAGFPFQTNPQAIIVAITSVLTYGFSSGAEQVISAVHLGPTSVYSIIARLGKMASLCILVGSLAYLCYF